MEARRKQALIWQEKNRGSCLTEYEDKKHSKFPKKYVRKSYSSLERSRYKLKPRIYVKISS